MPPGNGDVVVIVGGVATAAMVSEKSLLEFFAALSVTVTVKLKGPAVVGVPVIAPVDAFRFKPGGSVPGGTDHV